jgi:hypothetical protein
MSEQMSQIHVKCTDQVVKIVKAPVIASGGLNEVSVVFDFCEKWDGFVKTALFYRDTENVYYAVLDDNDTCVVPWEVCYADGYFFFSVFGEKGSTRRTSNKNRYRVIEGAITEGFMPSEPTPDVYDQIIALVAETKDVAQSFRGEAMGVIHEAAGIANTAAEAANAAAGNAQNAAANANEAKNAANEAAMRADNSTEAANKAATAANNAKTAADTATTKAEEATVAANNAAGVAEAVTAETIAARDSFLETAGESMQTIVDLLGAADEGPAIVCEETGSVITANDASNRLLQGLTLYGKTTQDGTPTPENPVELVSAGSVGSIGVTITDEADQNAQTLTASTPNGLPGIPVASGGNYTDENGQQWICDEIDFARGVYERRIGIAVYDGSDDEEWQVLTTRSGSKRFLIQIPTSKPVDSAKVANLLNSQFLSMSADSIYANDAVGCAINQNSSLIVHTPQIQTLDALKAHLENKPMTVAYELATPVETPLSAEELAQYAALHTNKPNTTVYNDAGAGMKLAYVADTKLYIDKKFNELAAAIVNNA